MFLIDISVWISVSHLVIVLNIEYQLWLEGEI